MKHLSNFWKRASCMAVLAVAPVVAALAQSTNYVNDLFDKANSTVTSAAKRAVTLAGVAIGLIGAVMLVWNFAKKAKGDQQSNDALMNWGGALLGVAIGLELINLVFIK